MKAKVAYKTDAAQMMPNAKKTTFFAGTKYRCAHVNIRNLSMFTKAKVSPVRPLIAQVHTHLSAARRKS